MSERQLRTWVEEILDRHATVGLALGVVGPTGLEFFHGHGFAEIDSRRPVTADTGFRIASITKTFTAVAIMQLWEQGLVHLDRPANAYLRSFRLLAHRAATDRPATVRHLLTHTSGVPEMVMAPRTLRYLFGESLPLDATLPRLGDYYRGALRLAAEPGTRFTYTDHNFAILGQIVEDVTGTPLAGYFREHIFDPLGMHDSDLDRTPAVVGQLATGYRVGRRGVRAVADRQWVTAAASSIYSTPRDMGRYLTALLRGGEGEHGRILKPESVDTMFAPQYQPDPRIPGMGLAFSRFNLGGFPAVEHEGILPGFNSDIFLVPGKDVAVMAFTTGARGAMFWLPAECGRLLGRILAIPPDVIRTDVPQHPELWPDLCGWYPFRGRLTDLRSRSIFGAGAHVFVRDGHLMIRALSPVPAVLRGFVLHPDDDRDPYAFRIDLSRYNLDNARILFRHDSGRWPAVCLDLYPIALNKRRR
jgi:CubicO group peptidase (beta-lactamase class C family)